MFDLNAKEIKKIEKIVDKIEELDDYMSELTDKELRSKTAEFKQRLTEGETVDDILVEAFAVCREGAWRALKLKPFRVQLIGGIALHQGRIAEMKTGEGKTLVATLPSYLNALTGKGVHVITVNDYLAKRDAELMGRVHRFLGLTVGCITNDMEGQDRQNAYKCDVLYGTNSEFGFDYLRDNMLQKKNEMLQRGLHFAIVDEVDSILIDEARTPLIISGQGDESSEGYYVADEFAKSLEESDYLIEEKEKAVTLTPEGIKKAEEHFELENLSDTKNLELNHYISQALKANYIMKKDVDYIVKDDEILIVDTFTGRIMYGRRFNEGLHQAIEAKENLDVRSESKTYATITIQNYFRMYEKLSGMTGTAKTEESEFREIYNIDVVSIPTNKPVIRDDKPDKVYATKEAKFNAIADKIEEIHKTGQPVLIGTVSIKVSEMLSDMLKKRHISHNVLNAKYHDIEAAIVAEAGRENAVTIATNMAGRGTDIMLGGNLEFEVTQEMIKQGFNNRAIELAQAGRIPEDPADAQVYHLAARRYHDITNRLKDERESEQERVKRLGGLYVIGTERHESRRIDNQLRGRSGRQGDPGESQFYISLEDDLMVQFGGERLKKFMGSDNSEALDSKMLSRSIEGAQKKIEGRNFGMRKYVLQYDNIMNRQRKIIYRERQEVLDGTDLRENIIEMTHQRIDAVIDRYLKDKPKDNSGVFALLDEISPLYRAHLEEEELMNVPHAKLREEVKYAFDCAYEELEIKIGAETMRGLERYIMLKCVDLYWMEHIDNMDVLKKGIGMRSVGQKDPIAAYADEGNAMFDEMIDYIHEDVVRIAYMLKPLEPGFENMLM